MLRVTNNNNIIR